MGFFPLSSLLSLLDVQKHLAGIFFGSARVHIFPTEPSKHPLEDVTDFCLEMVLVIVRPAEQGRDQLFEMRAKEVNRHRMYSQLDVTKRRLHDLSVVRRDKDHQGCEYFAVHISRY